MRILFIQLPLPGHGHEYIQGNVPYASAVMSAHCDKKYRGKVETETLPQILSDFGSDSLIVRYINNTAPEVVCFTSYLWNVERNCDIARMLRENNSRMHILMGGPEIIDGSWSLKAHHPEIDIFIAGEGEWFFDRFLNGRSFEDCQRFINGNRVVYQPADELLRPEDIPEPFCSNRLQSMVDNSIFMELTRGCPYRCAYCFYSRNCSTVRELSFQYLVDAINRGRDSLREIYILSPTFNTSKNFLEKLGMLASLKHNIRLHTEMKAGGIDHEKAELLYRAGFRSLEVGLQSLNPAALREVGRQGDPARELDGMKNLRDAGIDLKIGIIPGLPGDTRESFMKTVDVLCSEGLGDFVELYPLMVLPGTAIRERAEKDNILYQAEPPYYYLGGWGTGFEDILEIGYHITDKTGFRAGVFTLPSFSVDEKGLFVRGAILPGNRNFTDRIPALLNSIETYVFTFYYLGEGPVDMLSFRRLFSSLGKGLFHHVFFRNDILDENFFSELISREPEDLNARMHVFHNPVEGWKHRITQVFTDSSRFILARSDYSTIEPVLRLDNSNIRILKDCDPEIDSLLITPDIYPVIKKKLLSMYGDYPERLGFLREEDQEDFFVSMGLEWIRYPYSFSVETFI